MKGEGSCSMSEGHINALLSLSLLTLASRERNSVARIHPITTQSIRYYRSYLPTYLAAKIHTPIQLSIPKLSLSHSHPPTTLTFPCSTWITLRRIAQGHVVQLTRTQRGIIKSCRRRFEAWSQVSWAFVESSRVLEVSKCRRKTDTTRDGLFWSTSQNTSTVPSA